MISTNINVRIFAALAGVFLFVSCSNDDDSNDDSNTPGTAVAEVEAIVESGTWRITKFEEEGEDELYHFNGYNFTFADSGVLSATNGTNNYNGTWSITNTSNSSDDDDDDDDDLDFNIQFDLTNAFEDLNDDWDIISRSASKIELMDVSGGDGGIDYLTFEKN